MTPDANCNCPQTTHYHGTNTNYLVHGCRDTCCRTASSSKSANMRRQKAYGRYTKTRIDAQPARDHINTLRAQGMGVATIAKAAGLSHATIARILYGEPCKNNPPSRVIDPDTAHKILNTQPALTPGHLINPLGTRRRIQALAAIGYPLTHQAKMAGLHPDLIHHALTRKYVQVKTAETIKNLFNEYQLKPNKPGLARNRAIKLATTNGWAPPLAWDEDRIDDAKARPTGLERKAA